MTQALYVASELGIADELARGPRTAVEVAGRVGSDPDATFRLMRALASRAVLNQKRDGRFALTPMGQALRSDHPASIRPMISFIGSREHWEDWGGLLYSVRTGQTATAMMRGKSYFEHLDENPYQAAIFNDAMTSMAALANEAALPAYDFTPFRLIVDIGGGHGKLISEILRRAPEAKGILYDLSSVVDGAVSVLEAAGVADPMWRERRIVPGVGARRRRRLRAQIDRARLER